MSQFPDASIQTRLFERIKLLIPPNLIIVDVLSDLLGISVDSVYRRLRNETGLTIDEVAIICNHFKISFDEINTLNDSSAVTFTYSPLTSVSDYSIYLQSIYTDMQKIASADKSRIIWAAEDMPIFHYFKFPFLGAFKVFYWFHCIVSAEDNRDEKFNTRQIDEGIKSMCQNIYEQYAKIPSVEIWTALTFNPLLVQVEYVWQSGLFESQDDALHICSLIRELLNTLHKEADLTYKLGFHNNQVLGKGTYELYHSDIEIGNNTILVDIGKNKVLYLSHNTFNKIVTINRGFCDATERWINNIIKKSTLISGVSERQRYQFFNKMHIQLNKLEKRIKDEIS